MDYISDKPELQPIINKYLNDDSDAYCQFIVDCSPLSLVISSCQLYGKSVLDHLFYITRTWCYSLHTDRLRKLGRFNFWLRCHSYCSFAKLFNISKSWMIVYWIEIQIKRIDVVHIIASYSWQYTKPVSYVKSQQC